MVGRVGPMGLLRWEVGPMGDRLERRVLEAAARDFPALLPEPWDEVHRVWGFEGIDFFCSLFGGRAVYIPSARSVVSKCLRAAAAAERAESGASFRLLARKYGLSGRWLRGMEAGRG